MSAAIPVIIWKIHKHVATLEHKESLTLDKFFYIFYIMDCVKIQKETGDKKLKKLLSLLITCHAVLFLLLVSLPFFYLLLHWLAARL